ncbi:MAG: histidine phosphatase family protein [Bacteroidales bacterium]|nr:histidine phosphatase family protein [Bacteroidales bacterium]
MKELFLVRHAKSDWNNMDLTDIDRPLKNRGIRDALLMGEYILKEYPIPDKILTSPACRAFHTAILFSRAMKSSGRKIRVEDDMYLASYGKMESLVRNTEDEVGCLMLVGHNPGITDLANFFIEEFIHNIPTSGFVFFRFDTSAWKKIATSNLISHQIHYPKEVLKT